MALPYPTTVSDRGTGPPVVLVHGTPLDQASWDGVAEGLQPAHRVVTYDLRGHGSARATRLPPSYDVLVADLAAILDDAGLDRAHVVGHSFGGQIVNRFAAAHPGRVAALTIVCSRTTPYPPFAAAADVIDRDGIAAVAPGALARWFPPAAIAADAPAVRYARAHLVAEAGPALATAFRLIAAFDLGDRLARVDAPVRFVAAAHDQVATPDDLRRAASALPGGRFEVVADHGHMLPLEDPARVAASVSPRGGVRSR